MAVKFLVYTRWYEFVCELTAVESATHQQEINRQDVLTLGGRFILAKGDRILWRDGTRWHEHVVNEVDQDHSEGEEMQYVCEPALMADLRADHIDLCVANDITAAKALELALGQSASWEVGTVDDFGKNSITFHKMSAYEALLEVAGTWGCEIQASFEMDAHGVTKRKVNLLKAIGSDNGVRFEYGHGMKGVRKQVLSDDVITACYGYGKQLDTETDGVRDQLTFESINGGVPYVTVEDSVLDLWGIPDGKGGKRHVFGFYENTDCEDAQKLLDETKANLSRYSTPQISYETDIPFADLKGVHLGDTVQVVDQDFTPELRLEARIGAMERDLMSGETSSCTFGTVVSVLPDVYTRLFTAARTAGAGGSVTASNIMSGMNSLYNSGGAYICNHATLGTITANVPLDSSGNPTTTSGTLLATRLSNGRLYMATSVDSNGTWVWSEGVSTQSVVLTDGTNTGTLKIVNGSLYWNDTQIS